jgi:glycosyltransferase involved in cell wall biosynthesis
VTDSEYFVEGALRGPIKVVVVDVERGLCDIRAQRLPNGEYAAAWCLVRRRGSPVGLLELEFDSGVINAGELAERIAPLLAEEPATTSLPLDEDLPLASVVVPSLLAREDSLRDCLDALSALDYPRYEVLLVDNRSPAAGEAPVWISDYQNVRVLSEPRPGISAARNAGLAASSGDFVAFTDDDAVVDPGWLRAIGTRFALHPQEACVCGISLPRELETPAQLRLEVFTGGFGPRTYAPVTRRLLAPPARGRTFVRRPRVGEFDDEGRLLRTFPLYRASNFGAGVNMAFRTEALRAIGGFDPLLGTGSPTKAGEDHKAFVQLVWRGESVGLEPAAMVLHTHRRDDEALRRQILGWGTGIGAMFCALVLEDPRHLLALAITVPRFIGVTVRSYSSRRRSGLSGKAEESDGLRELARLELRGFVSGPAVYLRARWDARGSAFEGDSP